MAINNIAKSGKKDVTQMIQDISPYKYTNHYEPLPINGDSYIIMSKNSTVLVKNKEDSIDFPKAENIDPKILNSVKDLRYLFTIGDSSLDHRYFLTANESLEKYLLENGYEYITLPALRVTKPQHLKFAAVTACQLAKWYSEHKFCGHCGKPMKHSEKERMVYCENCKVYEYPKICPAVIVGVTNGDKLLLTKYANFRRNSYALIGGFAEIGETIEETVQREVMEEVGLRVKNIRYYKSQPWSFTSTLLFGFFCDVDGSDELTVDKNELSTAEWVKREDLPEDTGKVSLTAEMISKFSGGNR